MTLRARLKVARRGTSRAFDSHDPLTFMNGFFLFTTIVFAILAWDV